MLLACVPVAWLWMMPDELAAFGRSLVATNTFVSNFLFRADVDYFAEAAELKPLIHTWSLAVEEQFYVFFPLMLVALLKLRRSALLIILLAVATGSLMLAEHWSHIDRASNFYLLPPRAWDLLLGSLIALAPEYSGSTGRRQLLAITGLLMCVVPLVVFDQTMRLPGLLGLVPSVGAALVILFAGPDTLVGRCLGARIPVAIGLVSYSAYLWHQPVFVFARLRLYEGIDSIVWPALIALTFALARPSWYFVENPFRDKHRVSVRQLSAAAPPLTAALVIAGAALHVTNGVPYRVPEAAVRFERDASELRAAHRHCQFDESHPFDPSRACRVGPSRPAWRLGRQSRNCACEWTDAGARPARRGLGALRQFELRSSARLRMGSPPQGVRGGQPRGIHRDCQRPGDEDSRLAGTFGLLRRARRLRQWRRRRRARRVGSSSVRRRKFGCRRRFEAHSQSFARGREDSCPGLSGTRSRVGCYGTALSASFVR